MTALKGTRWVVAAIAGAAVPEEARRSVEFTADRIAGQVGVNRFSAGYQVSGALLSVSPAMSTRMAGPPQLVALESAFHRALSGEHTFVREADTLVIGNLGHGIVLAHVANRALT